MNDYFGRYVDFHTASKKEAGQLLGADNMIGDVLAIECGMEDGAHRAWLVNRFGQRIGMLNADDSRELSLVSARGLRMRAVLSFIAFTDHPGEGFYWGQVALICFGKAHEEAFGRFIEKVSRRMGDNVRTAVDLGPDTVARIVESEGEDLPDKTVPMPKKEKGTAIIKCRRSVTDKLIETGRSGNKGCFIASWIFLLALVTILVLTLKSCFF